MSFQALSWAVRQDTGNPTAKLILLMLSNYADQDNKCYPSQEHIARVCHCSRRCVITHIQKLEKQGFIKIKKSSNGMKSWNQYIVQCADSSHNTNIKRFDFKRKPRNKNFIAG